METWPLLALAGLGAFHGLNPAMGWLFAVGLGMQDRDRRSVIRALPPIAIGHELALAVVATLVVVLGVLAEPTALHVGAGVTLVAFGLFRFAKPRAHPRWTRMRVTRGELTWWSFLMSSAHGAGLMVAPVLIGASAAGTDEHGHAAADLSLASLSVPETAVALLVHVGAMVLVMGAVALIVYDRLGVAVLRKAWINLDHLWAATFVFAGVVTLFT